jgi:hypothetical protein
VSQTESIGEERGGREAGVFAEDYGDDGPDDKVYDDQDGDYSNGGVGEEAELRGKLVDSISEASRSREGMESHFEVRGERSGF